MVNICFIAKIDSEDKVNDSNSYSLNELQDIFDLLRSCNKYIDETMPWILAKDPKNSERLSTVLYNLVECIRISSVMLRPFLPDTSEKIFKTISYSLFEIFLFNKSCSFAL